MAVGIWLVMVGWGLKVVADNFPALSDQTQGVLAPDNLLWLYVGLVILMEHPGPSFAVG